MNKKAVIIIIVIIVVILLAISSWLVYKKFIKKPEDEGTDGDYNLPPINYPGGAPSGGYTTPISFPIKRGMNGDSVIQIQNAINKKCNAGLTPDGAFGPKTESALSSCYKTTSVTEALLTQMKFDAGAGAKCPPNMKPDEKYGCVSLFKPAPTPTGMQKGNPVFAKLPKLVLFSTPSGNSSFGSLPSNFDLSKSIGLYETVSSEGFSKVYVMVNYIKTNGMLGKAPAWAYVYTNLIRK